MPRKKAKFPPRKLPLTIIEPMHRHLELLVESGFYGNNTTDAARQIIAQHLRRLEKLKKLPSIAFGESPPDKNGDKK
jgi:hypothetical protein